MTAMQTWITGAAAVLTDIFLAISARTRSDDAVALLATGPDALFLVQGVASFGKL